METEYKVTFKDFCQGDEFKVTLRINAEDHKHALRKVRSRYPDANFENASVVEVAN